MAVSCRRFVPALIAAAAVAGGVWVESGLAQPSTQQPTRPSQPTRPPDPRQPGGPGAPGGPGMRTPSLEQSMRMINRGFRELKANIADATKREENLVAVWMMQQGCASAKRGKPEHLEGDPAEALEGFRRDQIKLMSMLIELEAALMDNKTHEAKALFDEIHEYEEASHEKYKVEEEEEEEEGEPAGPEGPADRPPPPGR